MANELVTRYRKMATEDRVMVTVGVVFFVVAIAMVLGMMFVRGEPHETNYVGQGSSRPTAQELTAPPSGGDLVVAIGLAALPVVLIVLSVWFWYQVLKKD